MRWPGLIGCIFSPFRPSFSQLAWTPFEASNCRSLREHVTSKRFYSQTVAQDSGARQPDWPELLRLDC